MSGHFLSRTDLGRSFFHGASIGVLSSAAGTMVAISVPLFMTAGNFDLDLCRVAGKITAVFAPLAAADIGLSFLKGEVIRDFKRAAREPNVPVLYACVYGLPAATGYAALNLY